jgi:hypothetical protein
LWSHWYLRVLLGTSPFGTVPMVRWFDWEVDCGSDYGAAVDKNTEGPIAVSNMGWHLRDYKNTEGPIAVSNMGWHLRKYKNTEGPIAAMNMGRHNRQS